MADAPPNIIATRGSWKILPLPAKVADLGFAESYTVAEFARIRKGLIPEEMEDKWFVFFEEPWLYVHRSWTGYAIYGVRFEVTSSGATAVESWVSRDVEQYGETSAERDRTRLASMIDVLLLGNHG